MHPPSVRDKKLVLWLENLGRLHLLRFSFKCRFFGWFANFACTYCMGVSKHVASWITLLVLDPPCSDNQIIKFDIYMFLLTTIYTSGNLDLRLDILRWLLQKNIF
jgi:hypothetical protein